MNGMFDAAVLPLGITFANGWVLLLLPVVFLPALIRRRPLEVLSSPWSWSHEGWADSAARMSWTLIPWVDAMAVALLILAAASPGVERLGPPSDEAGGAIMVALDVSASMAEGRPAPLDAARAAVEDLTRQRADVRMGLVTFAGTALTRMPPTTDATLMVTALETATAGIPDQGTAIGTALGIAAERLSAQEATERVIILITDGLNNAGAVDPVTAAGLARELGVQVHTVLLGDGDPEASALLAEVAQAGGGRVLVSPAQQRDLLSAMASVAPVASVDRPRVRTAAWPPILLAAVLLLTAARAVRTLRPVRGGW